MTKKKTPAAVNLPPFTWATEGRDALGATARLATPRLEKARINTRAIEGGEVVTASETVWRREVPPLVRALSAPHREALEGFAALVERVGASSGTVDPTSAGGGSSAKNDGPSAAAFAAASAMALRTKALKGRALHLSWAGEERVLPYLDLAMMVAIEGRPASRIAARMGVSKPTRRHIAKIGLAILDLATVLDEVRGG